MVRFSSCDRNESVRSRAEQSTKKNRKTLTMGLPDPLIPYLRFRRSPLPSSPIPLVGPSVALPEPSSSSSRSLLPHFLALDPTSYLSLSLSLYLNMTAVEDTLCRRRHTGKDWHQVDVGRQQIGLRILRLVFIFFSPLISFICSFFMEVFI